VKTEVHKAIVWWPVAPFSGRMPLRNRIVRIILAQKTSFKKEKIQRHSYYLIKLNNSIYYIAPMKCLTYKKQLNFLKTLNVSTKKSYGGNTKGKRKIARPISTKKWSHLVLKSHKAKGVFSLLASQNSLKVKAIIKKQSSKHGIQIADLVNMGNHIHLKVRPQSRIGFQRFLKSTTALIARAVTGARKGFKFGKFWDGLAFTRVIESSYELFQLRGYFEANRVESKKGYQERLAYLNAFNGWLKTLRLQT